jgi:hypothetical protein
MIFAFVVVLLVATLANDQPSCGFHVSREGKIAIPDECDMNVVVKGLKIRGHKHCTELEGKVTLGPVVIRGKKCRDVLHFASVHKSHKTAMTIYVTIMATLAIIATVGLVLVARIYWLTRGIPADYHLLWTTRNMNEWYELGDHEARVSIRKAIILALCLAPRSEACVTSHLDITTQSRLVNMYPGDVFCTQKGVLRYESSVVPSTLVHVFDTTDWTVDVGHTWGCAGGASPSVADCDRKDTRNFAYKGGWKMCSPRCSSHPSACWDMQRGTWEAMVCTKQVGDTYSVFTLGVNGVISPVLNNTSGCDYSTTPYVHVPSDIMVILGLKDAYACEGQSILHGWDLRRPGGGKPEVIDPGFITCEASWESGYKCDARTSSLSRAKTVCTQLPGNVGGIHIEVRNGTPWVSVPVVLPVMIKCRDDVVPSYDNIACNIEESHVWVGVGDFETTLYIRASSTGKDSSMTFMSECMPDEVRVPCDGRGHAFEVSGWAEGCNSKTDAHFVDHVQSEFMDELKPEYPSLPDVHSSTGVIGLILSYFLSSTGIMLALVLLMLCRR